MKKVTLILFSLCMFISSSGVAFSPVLDTGPEFVELVSKTKIEKQVAFEASNDITFTISNYRYEYEDGYSYDCIVYEPVTLSIPHFEYTVIRSIGTVINKPLPQLLGNRSDRYLDCIKQCLCNC